MSAHIATLEEALAPIFHPVRVSHDDLLFLLSTHLSKGGSYESFYRKYSSDEYYVEGGLDNFFCVMDLAPEDYSKVRLHICVHRLMNLLASRDVDSLLLYTTIIQTLETNNREDFLVVCVELCKKVADISSRDEMYSTVFWPHESIPKLAHLFDYDLMHDSEAWSQVTLDDEVRSVIARVLSPMTRFPTVSERLQTMVDAQ